MCREIPVHVTREARRFAVEGAGCVARYPGMSRMTPGSVAGEGMGCVARYPGMSRAKPGASRLRVRSMTRDSRACGAWSRTGSAPTGEGCGWVGVLCRTPAIPRARGGGAASDGEGGGAAVAARVRSYRCGVRAVAARSAPTGAMPSSRRGSARRCHRDHDAGLPRPREHRRR